MRVNYNSKNSKCSIFSKCKMRWKKTWKSKEEYFNKKWILNTNNYKSKGKKLCLKKRNWWSKYSKIVRNLSRGLRRYMGLVLIGKIRINLWRQVSSMKSIMIRRHWMVARLLKMKMIILRNRNWVWLKDRSLIFEAASKLIVVNQWHQ